jgi:hypothetical protein
LSGSLLGGFAEVIETRPQLGVLRINLNRLLLYRQRLTSLPIQ